MYLAETAADTGVHIKDLWFAVLVRFDNFLWTECHTDSAGLTPVMVKRNIKMLLFFSWNFVGFFCAGLFFPAFFFSHAIPRKNNIS